MGGRTVARAHAVNKEGVQPQQKGGCTNKGHPVKEIIET